MTLRPTLTRGLPLSWRIKWRAEEDEKVDLPMGTLCQLFPTGGYFTGQLSYVFDNDSQLYAI